MGRAGQGDAQAPALEGPVVRHVRRHRRRLRQAVRGRHEVGGRAGGPKMSREKFAQSRRWVIKVGSSLVTAKGQGLDHVAIADWCGQIATLIKQGKQIVLVSSGAVAEGMARLGLKKR